MRRLAVVIVTVLAVPLLGATLQVGPGGYASIQSAIQAAATSDEVVVAPGTYYENIDFLGKAIVLRSTDPNDPNVVAATIIDGSRPQDPNSNTLVTFRSGEGNSSILHGFTLRSGTGSWLLVSWKYHDIYWNRCGGAILCTNMSSPTILGNRFINNSAGEGGAIYIYGNPVNPLDPIDPPVHATPVITGNSFISNSAIIDHGFAPPDSLHPASEHGDGGAIVAFQGCDPLIAGNTFQGNHADAYGGAIHMRQWSNGLLCDNLIIGNDSLLGAGIHLTYWSSPTVSRNTIRDNVAGNFGGGGIYIYYLSNPIIERNFISHNVSTNGAGIGVYYGSHPLIRSNFITRNTGQGILLTGSAVIDIHNNTIADNTNGGILCQADTSGSITNNIVSGNGATYGIKVQTSLPLVFSFNNVHGNNLGSYGPSFPDQTGTNGNISVPPSFVAAALEDYHLLYSSPCINAADPAVTGMGIMDIDGHPRIMGGILDIGADEAMPAWNVTRQTQHLTIQDAIDQAVNGDAIILTRSRFTGDGNRDIDFKGKAVTLSSYDPDDLSVVEQTIIDAGGSIVSPHRAFRFHTAETADSVVRGITITGGAGNLEGGAILCEGAGPAFTNCIITGNSAAASGGAVAAKGQSDIAFVNCIITANRAGENGGAIHSENSTPTLTNCTILGNLASQYGGAVAAASQSDVTVRNCIIRQNRAAQGPQLAVMGEPASSLTAGTSNIEGGAGAVVVQAGCSLHWLGGNIDSDPRFVLDGSWLGDGTPTDPNDDTYTTGNWHITPGSPCDGAGSLPSPATFDIDGEPRIFGASIDIGADELVTNPADIDTDGSVDWLDLAMLADNWLGSPPPQAPDISGDGFVDFADFARLAAEWLWLAPWHPTVP